MTLVDSSAWVEFLRATNSPVHQRLKELVGSDRPLVTTGPIAMELLAGARSPVEHTQIRGVLAACANVPVDAGRDWEDAAALYSACRRAGSTPRKLLDCLIAAVAIREGVPVLAMDRDFDLLAEHTALETV